MADGVRSGRRRRADVLLPGQPGRGGRQDAHRRRVFARASRYRRAHRAVRARPDAADVDVLCRWQVPGRADGMGVDVCRAGRPRGAARPQHDVGAGSSLRHRTERRQRPGAVSDVHVRRRSVCAARAVVGKLLVLQQEAVRRGQPDAPTRTVEQGVEFRGVPGRGKGSHQTRRRRQGHPMGFRRHLGSVLLRRVVRHEQRDAVVHAADEPDAPEFR